MRRSGAAGRSRNCAKSHRGIGFHVIFANSSTYHTNRFSTHHEARAGQRNVQEGTGGVFEVRVDNEVIWSRKERGRFPEIKEIKQLIRDRVAPVARSGIRTPPDHIRLK